MGGFLTDDYYSTLGVPRNATEEQIKKAYRHKALETHPDMNKAPNAQEMFVAISEAFRVLSDPDERAAYDQLLADAERQARAGAGAIRQPTPQKRPVSARKQRRIDTLATLETLFGSNQAPELKRDFGMRLVQNENDLEVLSQIARSSDFYYNRQTKSPIYEVRIGAGLKLVELENDTVNLFNIGTDGYMNTQVRLKAMMKLIQRSTGDDKDLLDGMARSEKFYYNTAGDSFHQTRIGAGLRRLQLETDASALVGIAEDGYYHISVRLAAGKKLADTATAAEKEILMGFSRSNAAYYKTKDILMNARVAAGMALVKLEQNPESIRILMHDDYSFMPVRTAAGFKLVSMEDGEPGLIQLFTEASRLPAVQETIRKKLDGLTALDQKGSEFIKRNAASAPANPAGTRGVKLLR